MRKLIVASALFGMCVFSLAAQLREEGVAIVYGIEGGSGSYVTHPTHPFGTKLTIINPVNKARAVVQVGGRPDAAIQAMVEISLDTAEHLGIYQDIPTWVWVEVVAPEKVAARPAMRPRIGAVRQTGLATVQNSGTELAAFHPSIPIGTRARLTNIANGQSVIVIIRGRVQAAKERIVEVSRRAAQDLGIQRSAQVRLETVN